MGCCASNQQKAGKIGQREFKEHDSGAAYQPEKPEKVTNQKVGSNSLSGSEEIEDVFVERNGEKVRLTFGLPK